MAIDVSTFAVDIPSGTTVTAGQVIPLSIKDGPGVVRSGNGPAILKRVISWKTNASGFNAFVHVKNSDWVDPIINDTPFMGATVLDRRTSAYQSGNSCPLTPNSSWDVALVVAQSGTASTDTSFFVTIEVDYPNISAIVDPDALIGIPCTLQQSFTITPDAAGTAASAGWHVVNVDILKAGYEYALQKATINVTGTNPGNVTGLVSISNAAGMKGLSRTIPVCGNIESIGMIIEYASRLVKGPMDIRLMLFEPGTPISRDVIITFDFVKRRV